MNEPMADSAPLPPSGAPTSATSAIAAGTPPLEILLLEDSTFDAELLLASLETTHPRARVTWVKDEPGLLGALETQRFDLILSDLNMPNMNGLDFVKALSSLPGTPPPIVMITTEGSDEVIAEAMRRGATGYLKKPFTPEQIQQVIGPFLG